MFLFTAVVEIAGCCLTYRWIINGKTVRLFRPPRRASRCLQVSTPSALDPIYAAYDCVNVATVTGWI